MENLHFLRYTPTQTDTQTYGYYIIRIILSRNLFFWPHETFDFMGWQNMMTFLLQNFLKYFLKQYLWMFSFLLILLIMHCCYSDIFNLKISSFTKLQVPCHTNYRSHSKTERHSKIVYGIKKINGKPKNYWDCQSYRIEHHILNIEKRTET